MDDWLFLLETVRSSWTAAGAPSRIVAAVSGGADSVALLHALHALAKAEGISLFAAHVNHGLRESASLDAEFVLKLCGDLGVPCRVTSVQVQGKSEDAARTARYEALKNICADCQTPVLALAHHQRDQAETLLLHLFRGSGSGGLAAMGERAWRAWPEAGGVLLWRPFLDVPPEAIRRALSLRGLAWREDETNAQDDYLRNYIRHQVLPVIEERMPKAEQAMGRAAKILSEEDAYFRQEAQFFLMEDENACLFDPCRWIRYAPLTRLHPALRRYALRMACPVKMDWETTEALLALSPGKTMNLPEGWRAKCTREYLHFLPPRDAEPPMPGTLFSQPWQGETGDGKRIQTLPRSVYEQLRYGKPGDVIHPLGGPGTKSMQDYWVDKKLDQPFRRYMPLLCMGNQVVWAIGVGVGEEARVQPGDDAVLLRYKGFLPFHLPCPLQ